MATHRGNSGVLKIGAAVTPVGELTGFTIQTTIAILDDSVQGLSARRHKSDALPDWSGSIRGFYFPGDTDGQAVIIEGAELGFEGNPIGADDNPSKFSGTIIVGQVTITSDNGAIVAFEASFQGRGELLRGVPLLPDGQAFYVKPDGTYWTRPDGQFFIKQVS